MRDFFHHHGAELAKGIGGAGATVLGVLTSLQEQVEHTMRCISLGAGTIVAILTAISIIRGWKKRP